MAALPERESSKRSPGMPIKAWPGNLDNRKLEKNRRLCIRAAGAT
jgi:hypothetical protein